MNMSRSVVDAVVEVGKHREEAVDECVDDSVDEQDRVVEPLMPALVPLEELRERGSLVVVQRDQESLGVEGVHLDEPVRVRRRPVHDHEDEVVVVVDLGALMELLRGVQRQRVEPERFREDRVVGGAWPVQVEPEEAASREQPFGRLLRQREVLGAVLLDGVTGGVAALGHRRTVPPYSDGATPSRAPAARPRPACPGAAPGCALPRR
jgi:hypothetical protein